MAVRRVVEYLRLNKPVAILAERDFGQHGMMLPFLGKTALIPKGAAMFSLRTGAPILPCFFLREENNRFKFIIEKAIYPPSGADKITEEGLKAYIEQYLSIIERYIKNYPTQWLMFRDFTQQ